MEKISSNYVALSGEFAVLSKLAFHGFDANMTLGNTKNIDILVSDPRTNLMYQLEVKTSLNTRIKESTKSKNFGTFAFSWIMGKKHEIISRKELWYCFVSIDLESGGQRFFIVPSNVVSKYVEMQHKYWLNKNKKHQDSDMRVFRLGFKGEKYNFETPIIEDYENNWNFKK